MKKLLALVFVLIMLFSLAACDQNNSNKNAASTDNQSTTTAPESVNTNSERPTIKIGYVENLTGKSSNSGSLCKRGIDLAHELNPTVTIDGVTYDIELVVVDCKSDKVEAANCATRVIEKDQVVAIIGPSNSGTNLAMTEIVKTSRIPAIVASGTNPLITEGNPYYFRTCFTNNFHATVMAEFAYEQGYKKIALVKEITTEAAVDCANRFAAKFCELVGDPDAIVCEVGYNVEDQDYNAQLVALSQYEFDAVFAPNTAANLALMMQQAEVMGLETIWMGIDSCEVPAFLEIGGDTLIDSVYFSSFFDTSVAQTPMTTVMLDEYAKRYDDTCAAHTALSFDTYNILIQAISDAQSTDSEAICDALEAIVDFEGASGYLTFDENHNVENLAVVKTVGKEDGALYFKYTATVTP